MSRFRRQAQAEVTHFHENVMRRAQRCTACHTEHRGALASLMPGKLLRNPHGELIFRATATNSCSDCHVLTTEPGPVKLVVLEVVAVRRLREVGEGRHRPGHFAHCLQRHAGGQLGRDE